MPDDDWALGQNEVDVRNEARRDRMLYACHDPEGDWIRDQRNAAQRSLTPTERADVQQELLPDARPRSEVVVEIPAAESDRTP